MPDAYAIHGSKLTTSRELVASLQSGTRRAIV